MISEEKAMEHAREILESVRDQCAAEILEEVRILIKRHEATSHPTVLAAIAWAAYHDGCEAWDIDSRDGEFLTAFPRFKEVI